MPLSTKLPNLRRAISCYKHQSTTHVREDEKNRGRKQYQVPPTLAGSRDKDKRQTHAKLGLTNNIPCIGFMCPNLEIGRRVTIHIDNINHIGDNVNRTSTMCPNCVDVVEDEQSRFGGT